MGGGLESAYVTDTGGVAVHTTPVQPVAHGSPLPHPYNDGGKPVAFQKSTRAFVSGPEVAAVVVVAVGDRSASSETRTTPLKGDVAPPSRPHDHETGNCCDRRIDSSVAKSSQGTGSNSQLDGVGGWGEECTSGYCWGDA